MMTRNRTTFALIFLFLAVSNILNAQQLLEVRKSSYYTYIYTITSDHLEQVFLEDRLVDQDLDRCMLVDSFPTDKKNYPKDLPVGHYVFALADEGRLKLNIVSKNTMKVMFLDDGRKQKLVVVRKDDLQRVEADKVNINGKPIKYNAQTLCYELPYAKKSAIVRVDFNEESLIYKIEVGNQKVRFKRKMLYRWRRIKWKVTEMLDKIEDWYYGDYRYYYDRDRRKTGYLLLNKPKYLPGDTLRWSAFIINKHKRPINKALRLEFSQRYTDLPIFNQRILPTEKGSYNGYFVLSDTLKLDTRYMLRILNKRGQKVIVNQDFYYEDYQLDETRYTVELDKEQYHYKEPILLRLTGKDFNGNNVLDARAKVKVQFYSTDSSPTKDVFVPNVVWEQDFALDPIGETHVHIPVDRFPLGNFTYQVFVQFRNSNNEIHEETLYLSTDSFAQWFEVSAQGDSVKVDFVAEGKSIPKSGIMYGTDGEDTLFQQAVVYPYTFLPKAHVEQFFVQAENTIDQVDVSLLAANVVLSGHRNKDKVYFSTQNSRGLKLHYLLYKNRKLVEEGFTHDFDTVIHNPSSHTYHASLFYEFNGESQAEHKTVYVYKDELTVDIQQPSKIVPGQEVDIAIEVTDAKGKPARKVNLTAGAVNKKFGDQIEIPRPPYMGKLPKRWEKLDDISMQKPDATYLSVLTKQRRERMGLDTLLFYQMIYPKDGIALHYDSSKDFTYAQFSPAVYKDGIQQVVHFYYVDNDLSFVHPDVMYSLSSSNLATNFVACKKEGKYSVRIRLKELEYIISNVHFKKGAKLDLVLDANNIPDSVKVLKRNRLFSEKELEKIRNSLLNVSSSIHEDVWISQGPKTYKLKKNSYTKALGVFMPGPVNVWHVNGRNYYFNFRPGFFYDITVDGVKERGMYNQSISSFAHSEIPLGLHCEPLVPERIKELPLDRYSQSRFVMNDDASLSAITLNYYGQHRIKNYRLKHKQLDGQYYYLSHHLPENISAHTHANIHPGDYELVLVTTQNELLYLDSLHVQARGINYIKLKDKDVYVMDAESRKTFFDEEALLDSRAKETIAGDFTALILNQSNGTPQKNYTFYVVQNQRIIKTLKTNNEGKLHMTIIPKHGFSIRSTWYSFDNVDASENIVLQPKESKTVVLKANIDESYFSTYKGNVAGIYCRSFSAHTLDVISYEEPLMDKTGGMIVTDSIGADTRLSIITEESPAMFGDFKGGIQNIQSSVRKDFADDAYWKTDLKTDKNGRVHFKVKYPDDITGWQTYALAVNRKGQSGKGLKEVHAFKLLTAHLATPRFLIEGDSSNVVCKTMNYSGEPRLIHSQFYQGETLLIETKDSVENALIQYPSVVAPSDTNTHLKFLVYDTTAWNDGEQREIPVFRKGVMETEGSFSVLSSDTNFAIQAPESGELQLSIQRLPIAPMLDELQELKRYRYECMEQSASKLIAFLLDKQVSEARGVNFKHERDIKRLIKRLKDGRHSSNGWGWWPDNNPSATMTLHVLKALHMAKQQGYEVVDLTRSLAYLELVYPKMSLDERLLLWNLKADMGYKLELRHLKVQLRGQKLSDSEQLLWMLIQQKCDEQIDEEVFMRMATESYTGELRWGSLNSRWYSSDLQQTAYAYQIIRLQDSLDPRLAKIRYYYLNNRGKYYWNTFQQSWILSTIIPDMIDELKNQEVNLNLNINGKVITAFPYSITLKAGDSPLRIKKSGLEDAYLSVYQQEWISRPQVVDSMMEIKTWFQEDALTIDSLRSGKKVAQLVSLKLKKDARYVMLEVPIPAGCSYASKYQPWSRYETHREFHKDKVVIFCETLPAETYAFKIELEPRFSGRYTLNPAKAEMMYQPMFFGRDALNQIHIQ